MISVTEGDHGYNNSLPDMHPFFMAMGPAFRVNHTVETFKNVDVYPLICNILGIEPAPNNGSMDIVQSLLKPKKERKLYELDNTFVVCKYIHVPENCKVFISCYISINDLQSPAMFVNSNYPDFFIQTINLSFR